MPFEDPSSTLALEIKDRSTGTHLMNINDDLIEQRLRTGCQLFVAYHGGKPAGYIFSSLSKCTVDEIERTLYIADHECYFYDAFTYPEYRGNNIYPCLLAYAARFYQDLSYHYALIFTLAENKPSVQGILKAGFSCYGQVDFFNTCGHRFWRYRNKNGDIKSYIDGKE
jgi:GNAT superfamily N-acetyltransferase